MQDEGDGAGELKDTNGEGRLNLHGESLDLILKQWEANLLSVCCGCRERGPRPKLVAERPFRRLWQYPGLD